MLIYFNIIAFTTLTFDGSKNQTAVTVAYTSVTITFALVLAVIAFHVTRYAGLLSVIQKRIANDPLHAGRSITLDEYKLEHPLMRTSATSH